MCTRTWCVRPVSSAHSTSAASRSSVSRFQWVTARLPLPAGDDGDLLAVGRRAGERGVDRAVRGPRHAADDRQIEAVDAVGGELPGKPFVGDVGLGHHQQPRRVLVDAVDDARPGDPADARQRAAAMVEQGVDQRAVGIAGGRVDDQPGGLVDARAGARPRRRWSSGMSCATLCAGLGLRDFEAKLLVAADLGRRVAHRVAAARSSAPERISAFNRSRDNVGTAAASARSSRQPAWRRSSAMRMICCPPDNRNVGGVGGTSTVSQSPFGPR